MLFRLWIVGFIALFLYSFTQIDLSLTLSRASFIQQAEKAFQYIGYSNRPLSTALFLGILLFLFILYGWTLALVAQKKLTDKKVWSLVLIAAGVLMFSYNAFSYDFFNYMFAAKEVVVYHANPYQLAPWDFKKEPWLSFMHSVDKPYVYGPLGIVMTVPLFILGFGFFLPTFFLFKLLQAAFFLGCVWCISKILRYIAPKRELFGMIFFALNPLVLIEGLVSGHNDMIMMFFALAGIYFLLRLRFVWAFVLLILSFATKQVTIFLLAPFVVYLIPFARKYLSLTPFIFLCLAFQLLGGWFVLQQREMQPWYFLWIVPLVALLPENLLLAFTTIGISLGLLLRYVSFLYFGNWDQMANLRTEVSWMTPVVFIALGILVWIVRRFILIQK